MQQRQNSTWLATCVLVALALPPAAQSAGPPPLKSNDEIVKTKDGCGLVIDKSSPAAKWQRDAISKLTWGGACIDGLAMGEGLMSNGFKSPNQPALLPSTGWAWYGRRFGATDSRWDNGRTKKGFAWEGNGIQYNTLDTAAPVWSKDLSQYSSVGDSDTSVSAVWFDKPAVMVVDVKNAKSVQHPCPDPASPKGCEALWAQHAGPVIERVKAFLAENEPKAKARMLEVQPLVAQWKAKLRPGEAEKFLADAKSAGERETQRTSDKMKLERECWNKDNNAMSEWIGWKGVRSEGDARLGRYLKELYEGPCKDHPNTKNGLARANDLLRDAAKYKIEEDKQKADAAAYEKQLQAKRDQDRKEVGELVGKAIAGAASGTNSKERKQNVIDALSGGAGDQSGGTRSAGAYGTDSTEFPVVELSGIPSKAACVKFQWFPMNGPFPKSMIVGGDAESYKTQHDFDWSNKDRKDWKFLLAENICDEEILFYSTECYEIRMNSGWAGNINAPKTWPAGLLVGAYIRKSRGATVPMSIVKKGQYVSLGQVYSTVQKDSGSGRSADRTTKRVFGQMVYGAWPNNLWYGASNMKETAAGAQLRNRYITLLKALDINVLGGNGNTDNLYKHWHPESPPEGLRSCDAVNMREVWDSTP